MKNKHPLAENWPCAKHCTTCLNGSTPINCHNNARDSSHYPLCSCEMKLQSSEGKSHNYTTSWLKCLSSLLSQRSAGYNDLHWDRGLDCQTDRPSPSMGRTKAGPLKTGSSVQKEKGNRKISVPQVSPAMELRSEHHLGCERSLEYLEYS